MKPNVVFVLLDGARWDRLHTSAEFNDLTKNGMLLDNITTTIPYTIGSINATFSGRYGKENGIDAYYKMFKLKESIKIIPEILQENGYFTACDLLSNKIIADRGFDIHQSHDEYVDDLTVRHPEFIEKCKNEAKEKPLFLFLHFTRIHTVTVSEVLKKYEWNDKAFYAQQEKNLENYDKVFNEAGKYSSLIKTTLEKLQMFENTILIFFSDHGTGMGERFGERNYGSFTYEETIRSFFLFLGKNLVIGKTDALRETIDIFPTMLELLEIENKLELPGKSFASFLVGKESKLENKTHTLSETGALQGPYPSPNEPNVFAIKTNNYKLIYNKTTDEWKFYNLIEDPKEKNDIYEKDVPEKNKLKIKLIKWMNR